MPGSEPVQSVVRAAQIIQLTGQNPGGLGVGDIAARLGLKSPTVHHLLRTLVDTGMLEKVTGPIRYRIGPVLRQISSTNTSRELHPAATSVMRDMNKRLPLANLILAEYINGDITPTLRMSPDQPGTIQHSNLHPMNAYSSASALMFQALWPQQTIAVYRQRYPFGDFSSHWPSEKDLDAWLSQARVDGYAMRPSQNDTQLAVAAPIIDDTGHMVATIGASLVYQLDTAADSDAANATREKLIDLVKKSASRISQLLTAPAASGTTTSATALAIPAAAKSATQAKS